MGGGGRREKGRRKEKEGERRRGLGKRYRTAVVYYTAVLDF
jgi:hypothetical protein